VTFASASGGKGSMADWKKRVKEICSKVKDPTGKLGIPLPSYWSGGPAFEPQMQLVMAVYRNRSSESNVQLLQKLFAEVAQILLYAESFTIFHL